MGSTTADITSFTIQIEFTGPDLQLLENFCIDQAENILKNLSCVAAHLKIDERCDLEKRNKAIGSIQRAVETIKKAQGHLYSEEYPASLIEDISAWADSLKLIAFKKTSNSDKRYIAPKENSALSAISALLTGKGQDINLNPQRDETGSFLSISEIIFRAAGLPTDIDALAKRAHRIVNDKGELSNFSDGVYLNPPSLEK